MHTISEGLDLDAQREIESGSLHRLSIKPTNQSPSQTSLPDGYEMFQGKPTKVVNADRSGWWRFNDHYDRNGYCDNPGRGF